MRLSFWPTVILGVVGSGVAAIAGHRSWATAGDTTLSGMSGATIGERPEVTAFALVALACWGVLLVTRGWFRRAIAVLTAAAGVATLVAAVLGLIHATDAQVGWFSYTDTPPELTRTAWGWVAIAAGALATLAGVIALRSVTTWPEMGRKYDAPTGDDATKAASRTPEPVVPETPLDVWKALDEGRDPTEEPPAQGSH